MYVVVIDIGSNSSRANVFQIKSSDDFAIVDFHRIPTALISYVDAEKRLMPEGIELLCDSLRELKVFVSQRYEIDSWSVFATASLRGLSNSNEVLLAIKEYLGFSVDIVSGEQEASYGFVSLRNRFDIQDAVLADVGGGSTELVVAQDGVVRSVVSLPLGCRALSDEFPGSRSLSDQECEELRLKIRKAIEDSSLQFAPGCPFFGIGGTAKALHRIIGSNEPLLPEDFMERAHSICPERGDTIVAGAFIFEELWKFFQPSSFLSSSANAREGYFISNILPKYQDK